MSAISQAFNGHFPQSLGHDSQSSPSDNSQVPSPQSTKKTSNEIVPNLKSKIKEGKFCKVEYFQQ